MKFCQILFVSSALCSVLLVHAASAYEADDALELRAEDAADPRLFFVNFTSSLVQVNATILAYGLLFLAILGAAAVALYYLYLESQSSGYGSNYGQYSSSNSQYYNYARSAQTGYDFNALNILQWISMAQEAYEKFDVNDLECQKRLICEVMREPQFYGNFAKRAKSGFQWAGTLADLVALPDDVRELVDEYLDASSRSESQKECHEYFQCPFSIKETISKNLL